MRLEDIDAWCKHFGWPTVTEQQAHWDKKDQDIILSTLNSLTTALTTLTKSVEGLLAICKDQQTQIDNLKQQKNN